MDHGASMTQEGNLYGVTNNRKGSCMCIFISSQFDKIYANIGFGGN